MRAWPTRWCRFAALCLAAMVAVACTGDESQLTPDPEPPATLPDGTAAPDQVAGRCAPDTDRRAVWVHDHEPPDLLVDPFDVRAVAGWLQHGVHEGLHRRGVDGTWQPQLLAETPSTDRDEDDRLRVSFTLRDDLRFSDGTELTAEHVRGTYDLLVADDGAGARLLHDPARYDRIDPDSWEVDGQAFSFALERDDVAWSTWFPRVLPTHVLPDLDAVEEALRELHTGDGPVPASGPFAVTDWIRGERLVLERNDAYHGAHPARDDLANTGAACVAGLELRFVEGTAAVAGAVRSGSADLAFVPPAEDLPVGDQDTLRVAVAPDPTTEALVLNLADPHLRDPRVREALAVAIDRTDLVARLHEPLLGDAVPPAGATSVLTSGPEGLDSATTAGSGSGDTDRAAATLREAGYERDGSGTYTHPERGPLTIRLSTTGDDPLRERQQQLVQAQLRDLGWDVTIDNRVGQAHLDEQLLAPEALACASGAGEDLGSTAAVDGADCDRFDVAQVALTPSVWPLRAGERFRTDNGLDPSGLRSEAFDILLDRCADAVDEEARACAVRLDRILVSTDVDVDGLVVVPLAARPHLHLDGPRVLRRVDASPAAEAGPLVDAAQLVLGPRD